MSEAARAPALPLDLSAAPLAIRSEGEPPRALARVTGEIDMTTAPDLERELSRLLALGYRRVDLDLSGVPFLSAAGLSVLTRADHRYRAVSAQLVLARLTQESLRLLALTGLDGSLTLR